MRKVLFKIESSGKEGHETEETKKKKFEEYKKLLKKDGEKILGEKEIVNRRGKHIELTLE